MKSTEFTTVEKMAEMASDNQLIQLTFIKAYKGFAERFISLGKTIEEANRLAFDLLVKENGFEKLLLNLTK